MEKELLLDLTALLKVSKQIQAQNDQLHSDLLKAKAHNGFESMLSCTMNDPITRTLMMIIFDCAGREEQGDILRLLQNSEQFNDVADYYVNANFN